ncbi:MAG TPA: thioredoxin family protein [Terriglobia bacterium]|nr:thioredoxin family protein [Terriglobia bacterium]
MAQKLSMALAVVITAIFSVEGASAVTLNDENADAHQLISAAIGQASRLHKNIILDFGANWCFDCHVLESEIETPGLAVLVDRNFVVVQIDVGKFDKNLDLARKYHVPLKYGIPALAVLDAHGRLLYAQDHGQFEDARHMNPSALKVFLDKWKPRPGLAK